MSGEGITAAYGAADEGPIDEGHRGLRHPTHPRVSYFA